MSNNIATPPDAGNPASDTADTELVRLKTTEGPEFAEGDCLPRMTVTFASDTRLRVTDNGKRAMEEAVNAVIESERRNRLVDEIALDRETVGSVELSIQPPETTETADTWIGDLMSRPQSAEEFAFWLGDQLGEDLEAWDNPQGTNVVQMTRNGVTFWVTVEVETEE